MMIIQRQNQIRIQCVNKLDGKFSSKELYFEFDLISLILINISLDWNINKKSDPAPVPNSSSTIREYFFIQLTILCPIAIPDYPMHALPVLHSNFSLFTLILFFLRQ